MVRLLENHELAMMRDETNYTRDTLGNAPLPSYRHVHPIELR